MTASGAWAGWGLEEPDPPPTPQPTPPAAEQPAEDPPALEFSTLPAFVVWLTSVWRRQISDGRGRTWCPAWWRHPEAIEVLEGLWRAWERLRLPEHAAFGRATFWRDFAYPLLRELTAEDGPLLGCSPDTGHASLPLPALRCQEPPAGMFTAADAEAATGGAAPAPPG